MKESQVNTEKLREVATAEQWSDRAIARNTGLTNESVGKILNGKVEPKATNLKKICDTIGLPIGEAFIEKAAA